MTDADLISTIRQLRKLIAVLDSVGYITKALDEDSELSSHVPRGLHDRIINVASTIHHMLMGIEKGNRYKQAAAKLCINFIKEGG